MKINMNKCIICGRKAVKQVIIYDSWGNPIYAPACKDYPKCKFKAGKLI